MRTVPFLVCLLVSIVSAQAQTSITGLWLTRDHDGVIQIYNCGIGLCGRLVGFFLDRTSDPTPRDYRGVSQCDLPLISDARPVDANLWRGHIINPRNGKVYGVEMHLTPRGTLAMRGFLGVPLLGQTQIWTPYEGSLPRDCRITPAPAFNGLNGGGE